MKIMIGCDHGGYSLKQVVAQFLRQQGHEVEDIGTNSSESVDYPQYAVQVARSVASGQVDRGILICGSGIGMCMTANRIPGARAALACEPYAARLSRRHNDSNILCLGGRLVGDQLALEIVSGWLQEEFEGGRHQRRVNLIDQLTQPQ
ncbi:MAG TPA: ribose 5-phosphate isomerase B [Syntrophobacteraceae bacterium]|nr:ribose 5-phosphate isomerase B [Syntrophobacteraceae bacterium]HBZ56374.1 ribose 5-phosphate isomerase B [Syntrophobacteraceae bacterium]